MGAEHFRENSHFRENDNENGRNFAKINYFRMSFENFAKMILRKFGNPNNDIVTPLGKNSSPGECLTGR